MHLWPQIFQLLLLSYLATKAEQSFLRFQSGEKLKLAHGKAFVSRVGSNSNITVKNVEELYFTQVLDHDHNDDGRNWPQRYFINREFFTDPDGPVFMYIVGEWEASPNDLAEGFFFVELAREMGALLISLEHRYYGKSHPTPDASVQNLKYLSSRQALKDLLVFISEMKRAHNLQHNKWVAFGQSYSGSLAAWFKLKFPESVDVAVASSAPIAIVADFKEYREVIISSLFAKHSPDCVDAINEATGTIRGLVERGPGEWEHLKQIFNMCDSFEKTPLNVQSIYYNISRTIAGIVQYNNNHHSDGTSGTANTNIPDICNIMTNVTDDLSPLERYANMYQFINERVSGEELAECNDFRYESFVKYLRETEWSSDSVSSAARQWTYQTCTEFGSFQTSTFRRGAIFGDFPEDFFLRRCRDVFGQKFTPNYIHKAIRQTKGFYGGIDAFKHVAHVIFSNSKIDPWYPLGITNRFETNPQNTVVFIPDSAHHADSYATSELDSPPLIYARSVIRDSLQGYLGL